MLEISLKSSTREELVDITAELGRIIADHGWEEGALLVYCPHTTGAVTVNEGADPDVARDIVVTLKRLIPQRGDYRHAEGNSDAHLKTSLTGPDQLLVVSDGKLRLGTWQRVFFCEFDGPRTRRLWVQFLPAA